MTSHFYISVSVSFGKFLRWAGPISSGVKPEFSSPLGWTQRSLPLLGQLPLCSLPLCVPLLLCWPRGWLPQAPGRG